MQLLRAAFAQILGAAWAWILVRTLPALPNGLWRIVLLQGLAAAIISRLLRQPSWWIPLHLLFMPALLAAARLQLPSGLYLAAFILTVLIFWRTVMGDAPLYLSSAAAARTMADIASRENAKTFAELGAGIGSVALPLARLLPKLGVDAWERAPLTWAVLAWRSRKLANLTVRSESLWAADLSQYDLVYAFLSPAPMRKLGEKVRREMRPDSLFVSSSFPVPGWAPEAETPVKDLQGTILYCYRITQQERS